MFQAVAEAAKQQLTQLTESANSEREAAINKAVQAVQRRASKEAMQQVSSDCMCYIHGWLVSFRLVLSVHCRSHCGCQLWQRLCILAWHLKLPRLQGHVWQSMMPRALKQTVLVLASGYVNAYFACRRCDRQKALLCRLIKWSQRLSRQQQMLLSAQQQRQANSSAMWRP